MSRASSLIGTAVCMVYNVFIADSWTGVDMRLEHDLGVKEVWEKHVSNKMFRFQVLTLKINIREDCVCSFLVIFYQPFPQWEGQKRKIVVLTCISPTGFTQRSNQGTELLAWTESLCKEVSQNSSFIFAMCLLSFFFEWVVAILAVSEHPAAWSVVKLREDMVASHFVSIWRSCAPHSSPSHTGMNLQWLCVHQGAHPDLHQCKGGWTLVPHVPEAWWKNPTEHSLYCIEGTDQTRCFMS